MSESNRSQEVRPDATLQSTKPPESEPSFPGDMTRLDETPARGPVTFRAVALGLLAVIYICWLTPFNDYAMGNTFLVGNFLPIGLLLFFGLFVLVINAAFWKYAPRRAFSAGELAVALAMGMVSCTLPSSGLMRYLPASIVGMHDHAFQSTAGAELLRTVGIPDWLLPTFESDDPAQRGNEPVVRNYVGRTPPDEQGWMGFQGVPWRKWVTPFFTWGIFLTFLYGTIISLVLIARRQWAENERLAFPLASVYLSLIEPPEKGRSFNSVFSSKGFWVAFSMVFLIHGLTALNRYEPRIPDVGLTYDLYSLFSEQPFASTHWGFKSSTFYLSMIGITYFLQTKIAFSIWFFYLMFNVVLMTSPYDFTDRMQADQSFGGMLVFAGMVIWIGRHHWMVVIRQMIRGHRPGEPEGGYVPYWLLGWTCLTCATGLCGWFVVAGVQVIPAIVTTLMLLLVLMLIARIVAETGLLFAQVPALLGTRPLTYAMLIPSEPIYASPKSVFMQHWMTQMFMHDTRESVGGFAANAIRTADHAAFNNAPHWRRGLPLVGVMILALAVGYFVAGASTLRVEYTHGETLNVQATTPNPYGMTNSTRNFLFNQTADFIPPRTGPNESHSHVGHFLFGALFTGFLGFMRLTVAWWPFHPVGYFLAWTYPVARIWISVFVGWLLKVLIVRFGGATLLRAARPVFLGLIFGEAGSAAFWLLFALVAHALGMEFVKVSLLPE